MQEMCSVQAMKLSISHFLQFRFFPSFIRFTPVHSIVAPKIIIRRFFWEHINVSFQCNHLIGRYIMNIFTMFISCISCHRVHLFLINDSKCTLFRPLKIRKNNCRFFPAHKLTNFYYKFKINDFVTLSALKVLLLFVPTKYHFVTPNLDN